MPFRVCLTPVLYGEDATEELNAFIASHRVAHVERKWIDQGTCTDRFQYGRFHQFLIRDPKERIITAPCFEERVVHHAIMNACEPVLDRWLIDDTFACRVGRGRLAAVSRSYSDSIANM